MSKIYGKDSWNRFGDDLSQLLLSYMPFKDQFRYEGVSKQWQRLIFKSQSHVCLYQRYEGSLKTPLYLNTTQVDIKCIELVLKKLSNITQIELKDMGVGVNRWLINLIVKHCHRVNDILISCDGKPLKSEHPKSVRALLATFDKQLRVIDIKCLYRCNPFDLLSINSNEVLFPKLRKLSLKCSKKDGQRLAKFVNIYGKQMKSIDLTIDTNCDDEAINTIMTCFSQMPALIDFQLIYQFYKPLNELTINCIKQMGTNCRQLKRLSLVCNIAGNDWQLFIQMINQYFTQLRRFKVKIIKDYESTPSLTSNSLNGFKRLTHLSIISMAGHITTDEFMANIDQQLPRLQAIELVIYEMNITDNYLYSLAKLPKLRDVYLFGATDCIHTDAAVNHLMANKCKVDLSGQRSS